MESNGDAGIRNHLKIQQLESYVLLMESRIADLNQQVYEQKNKIKDLSDKVRHYMELCFKVKRD